MHVRCQEHPRARNGYVPEHVLVMEKLLGRYLEPGECVHHKDENKENNRPDNLELTTNAEHARHHARERGEMSYEEAVRLLAEGLTPGEVAARFKVSVSAVYKARARYNARSCAA